MKELNQSIDQEVNILYLNPISDPTYNQAFADSLKEYKYPLTDLDVASFQPTSSLPKTLDNLGFRAYESLDDLAKYGVFQDPYYFCKYCKCF